MSNYKFTPGPWHRNSIGGVSSETTKQVALIAFTGYEAPDEYEANAKLIAAAPELLKFAEHFLDNLEGFMPEAVRTIAELKALIKKATE